MATRLIAWFRKSLARAIMAAMLIPSIGSILLITFLFERQSIDLLTRQMEGELVQMVAARATELELRAQIINQVAIDDVPVDHTLEEVESLKSIVRDIQVLYGAGYGFLVDTNGQVIVHPSLADGELVPDFASLENMTLQEEVTAFQKHLRHMVDGNSGITYYRTDTDRFLLAYAPVPSLNWSLGITVPQSQVIAPANAIRFRLLVITSVLILFVTILSYWLARVVHQPLRKLFEGVHQVSQNGYAEPITVQSFNDLNDLAIAFNEMAVQVHERERQFKSRLSRLKIEIDEQKRSSQLEQITETDFFKRLELNVSQLRTHVRNGKSG